MCVQVSCVYTCVSVYLRISGEDLVTLHLVEVCSCWNSHLHTGKVSFGTCVHVRKCLSAQAAVTTYHRLGGLSNRDLFLTVLEPRSKIKVAVILVPGESPLPGL